MIEGYPRWKVILGVVVFLMLMGLAGREDMRAAQMQDTELCEVRK